MNLFDTVKSRFYDALKEKTSWGRKEIVMLFEGIQLQVAMEKLTEMEGGDATSGPKKEPA